MCKALIVLSSILFLAACSNESARKDKFYDEKEGVVCYTLTNDSYFARNTAFAISCVKK